MSKDAEALAVGHEVEFRGKRWVLDPLKVQHYAMFSAWLEGRAWAALDRNRRHMSDETYSLAIDRLEKACAAGAYDFGSETFVRAAASYEGLKRQAYMVLSERYPQDADEEFVDELFREKLPEIMRAKRSHGE